MFHVEHFLMVRQFKRTHPCMLTLKQGCARLQPMISYSSNVSPDALTMRTSVTA